MVSCRRIHSFLFGQAHRCNILKGLAMSDLLGSGSRSEGTVPQTRHRRITACLRCRDRKKKCDRKTPVCQNCEKEREECVYASDGQQLREHKQKLHNLNRSFAKAASRENPQGDHPFPRWKYMSQLTKSLLGLENPELNPLIVADPAYEDDVDDDATDVGIKCGKLRISDRIGGMVRPKMVDEVRWSIFNAINLCPF